MTCGAGWFPFLSGGIWRRLSEYRHRKMHHIAAAMVFGVIFLSMPLAIIGNNFCNIWDHRRRVIFVERFNESYEKKFPDSTLPGRQDMVFMLRKYAKKKTTHFLVTSSNRRLSRGSGSNCRQHNQETFGKMSSAKIVHTSASRAKNL